MSNINSSADHLTLNADGASKDIKFQANGVEKASISSAGAFTSTSIDATKLSGALPAIDGSALTNLPSSGASYAIIADRKTAGTHGGTFTNGAWRTRALNTEVSDVDGIVTIASNQFTLQAGKYIVDWSAIARNGTNSHLSRLYNATDATLIVESLNGRADGTDGQGLSLGKGYIDIASAKAFEIQHICQSTVASNGFGLAANAYFTVSYEQYLLIKITKVA